MARKLVMASPRSGKDIDNLALKLIKIYQPEVLKKPSAFDIERFFECELYGITGVNSDYKKLAEGLYGYTDSESMECVISLDLIEDNYQLFFCRSTMGHETGHAIMHVSEIRKRREMVRFIHDKNHDLRLFRESEIPIYRNPEWQAWRFSGAVFMPEETIRMAIEEGYKLMDISQTYQVNQAFVRTRLRALKIDLE